MVAAAQPNPTPVQPALATDAIHAVRYIKLGEKGGWTDECIQRSIIRISFESEDPTVFDLCINGKWNEVLAHWHGLAPQAGTAALYTNQLQAFYTDSGTTLWFTIHNYRLWWTLIDPSAPPERDDKSSFRRCSGWSSVDAKGEALRKDTLAGFITSKELFRGTSCAVEGDERRYLLLRINGQKLPEVEDTGKMLVALEDRTGGGQHEIHVRGLLTSAQG
jgi:hypothetical protein